ncbi:MAG: TonB-dependent receptor family protein [Chitinophagaceae bacterium]|nr:TonB-dependent receptor family protein [Chitinophagaceae bacterium]
MKKVLLILFTLSIASGVFAQKATVKGTVKDTVAQAPIELASVAVVNQGDSVLQTSVRTDKNGNFTINNLKDGAYILLVSYPKYVDYVDFFDVVGGEPVEYREIPMTQTALLLDEIVISPPPVRIKGDTTEYMADSFKVRENATVEELLKELPGIQVDKDGKIVAQGKQVEKVLVDGDEFFSDDPTVATKNLRADAIQKVQVYDKRSDQAAFTGIDDGQEVRTIDLKLKDGAKKGYFGKVSAGGLDKYYNLTGMLNSFKSKRKLSVFGVASSTDQTGLSWSDQGSLGFNDGFGGFRGGFGRGMGGFGDDGLDAGNFFGQGLPESIKAGAHYSDKWNEGKNSAGGNYLFNKIDIRAGGSSFSENTLFDSLYYSRNNSSSNSSQIRQSLSGVLDLTLDSTSQFKITASGSRNTSDNYTKSLSESLSETRDLVNSSTSLNTNHGESEAFNTNAFYRKRFKTPGRTISINFNQRYNNSTSDGFLNNEAKYYDPTGALIRTENTDQNKVNTTKTTTLEARISYTNPLGKKGFLEINYSYNHNNNDQVRLTYNKDVNDKYAILVDSLSSDFKYIYNTNTGGLNYRYNGKKLTFSAGGSLARTDYVQEDNFDHTRRPYGYTNIFPRADLRYKLSAASTISINYNGSTQAPTIDQLQPLKNNSDPLNIVVGNPDLRQSFRNSIGLNFNSFQMLQDQYIFLRLNYNSTSNQISSSYTIDQMGRRVTKYINVDGVNYSISFSGNYSRQVGKTWRIGISPSSSISKNTNFINGKENLSSSFNITPGLELSKRDVQKYELELRYRPSYNSSTSSISTAAGKDYWIQNISFDGRVTLPGKIDLGTDISYEHRQQLDPTDTKNEMTLWNAYIEKRFLKKEQLTLRFSVNDILDQNKGYERIIQPNAIIERNYLTFQRYGLLTLTYNFNTTGAGSSSSGGSRGGGMMRGMRF